MTIISLYNRPFDEVVELITKTLLEGGVVLVPTETVYGLITLASNRQGIEQINRIKKREVTKQYQILINSIEMAKKLDAHFSNDALKLSKKFWPGGLTLILKANQSDTIGLRYPSHRLIQSILDKIEEPLVATSANISGRPPLQNVKNLTQYFRKYTPDLVIDSGTINGEPSTVVNCCQAKSIILREGMITTAQVKETIQHV